MTSGERLHVFCVSFDAKEHRERAEWQGWRRLRDKPPQRQGALVVVPAVLADEQD